MKKHGLKILLAISAVSLASCGDDGNRQTAKQGAGGNQPILSRSVTDEMLPYDTVQSKPPLAEPEATDAADRPSRSGSAANDGSAPADEQPEAAEDGIRPSAD